jgi:hypothetical protein
VEERVPPELVELREEIFFGRDPHGELRQWITVTVASPAPTAIAARLRIDASGVAAETDLELRPGVHGYRGFAPVLWPDRKQAPHATATLTTQDATCTGTVSVGSYRPWTVYLLSDICTDYTWVYDQEELPRAHDAAVTQAELAVADATQDGPAANRNHYNLVHAREAEFFLDSYPAEEERFFDHVRRGTITFNPFFNMAATGNMSLEELIRQFYPARRWAVAQGLEIGYANHQETPTITWIMATVLAGCGIGHLVKSILPYECPWAARLEEPPLFVWEGPDGSRVRVRRRNTDYVEGNFVLRDLRTTNLALHERILPEYARQGAAYPFDAIALVGCYGDLAPESAALPARKVQTITAYNGQGWEFPKLVNASHQQFWDDVDRQIDTRQIQLPIYRGDYGTAWEAWAMSLAADLAGWRRAQERAGVADKLAAVLYCCDRAAYDLWRDTLAQGWIHLTYLADHAWNGANDANRRLNALLRRRWQMTANAAFDDVIVHALAALSRQVGEAAPGRFLVFNGLGWARSGLVRLPGVAPTAAVTDLATGAALPTQAVQEGDQPGVWVLARDVPPLGYRVLAATREMGAAQGASPFQRGEIWLEGPYYRLEVSPTTGGICRLYDKVRGKELVDADSPYHLNQCLYWTGGSAAGAAMEHTARAAAIEPGAVGPLFAQVVVRGQLKGITLTTTITVYAHLDRVDLHNAVEKEPSQDKEEMAFAFPFDVPDRRYRVETPGAILAAGEDQLPGAGQAITAVRAFVDVANADYGVTLAMADSGFVEFGHRTSLEDPQAPDPANSTVLAPVLGNWINWREVTHDQAGHRRFTFRFSVCGHKGGFDPVQVLRAGWEAHNALEVAPMPDAAAGASLGAVHSFAAVKPEHTVLSCLKVGEEGDLVARIWEYAGCATTAALQVDGLGTLVEARQTDLLERDGDACAREAGAIMLPVKANGLATCRLVMAAARATQGSAQL